MQDVFQVGLYLVLIGLPVVLAFRGGRDKVAKSTSTGELPSLESMTLTPRRITRKKPLTRHAVTAMRR
jgi:hypothetical protein